ncbi:MAG: adenylate cyclase, partial [Proteobacteria bacterium]|nr:adenylate cyclase [Pseudomonadota bacterium]NIS71730.1 adenylate cyclase [Pseudomonadota bacterium]
ALIVLERRDRVDRLMKEGVALDGEVSRQILASIFQKRAPAHDGAAIVRAGRLSVLGSYLPLTEREGLPQHFGTRHRAAIGLTERCDALGVVVSEENQSVSLAQEGKIEPHPDAARLKEALEQAMGTQVRHKKSFLVSVREWVTHYWKTKAIAFGIVILAWFLFVGRQPLDVGLTAPLTYRNVPEGLGIKDGAP